MTPAKPADIKPSQSFAPLVKTGAHTLVLGTMPGQKSLECQQYYAHPRNALWPILCAIATHSPPTYTVFQQLSYEQRCTLVTKAGFALWDVLHSCVRPGSLDSNIDRQSEQANDIAGLIKLYPSIKRIVCNGRTSQALFKRHIISTLSSHAIDITSLPSTSPAMATLNLQAKFEQWNNAIRHNEAP